MIKLFFAIFFIAELIIAFAIIIRLYKLDRCVNSLNAKILSNRHKILFGMMEIREALERFVECFDRFRNIIRKKRREYTFRFIKTFVIYMSILLLKGKYKKTMFAYQLFTEIYAGITEANI